MGLLVVFLIALVLFALLLWSSIGLIGLVLTLIVAGIVGWLADLIVPGRLPFGWLGAIATGLLGGWLGYMVLGPIGPSIAGVNLIPAIIGAVVLAFLFALINGSLGRRETL